MHDDTGEQLELPLAFEEFLTWLTVERGRAPSTIVAYRRDLRAYWQHLLDSETELGGVAETDLTGWIEQLRASGLAPATIARRVVAARSLHRFLAAEGTVASDPLADLEQPGVPAGLPKALAERDIAQLIDAVTGDDPTERRDRALLEVLYGTGARISEAVGLSLRDVDLADQTLRLFGKGARERVVPLAGAAHRALEAWLSPGGRDGLSPQRWARRGDAEAVFLNRRGGRLTRQGAWEIVRRRARAVGLESKLSPHVLRHSCATHMLDHGADIRSVQELLGHASISTTQVYTRVSSSRLRAIYDEAHPRARGPDTTASGP